METTLPVDDLFAALAAVQPQETVYNFPGDTLLTWSQDEGQILSRGIRYIVRQKFNVGFEYDALVIESASNNAFKMLYGNRFELTSQEFDMCMDYISKWSESPDLPVFVYTSDRHNFVMRTSRGEAEAQGYSFTYNAPPAEWQDIAIYNPEKENWERALVVIRDDGQAFMNPSGLCPKCRLVFTEEQWNAFPHPTNPDNDRYNFDTGEWYDARDLEQTRAQAISATRYWFVRARLDYTESVPPEEMDLWRVQEKEVKGYREDPNFPTPFIEGMLSAMQEANPELTKETLVARIAKHLDDALTMNKGKVHGEMYTYIDRIRAAVDLPSIDAIQKEVQELFTPANKV